MLSALSTSGLVGPIRGRKSISHLSLQPIHTKQVPLTISQAKGSLSTDNALELYSAGGLRITYNRVGGLNVDGPVATTNTVSGGNLVVSDPAGGVLWSGSSRIYTPSNGVFTLYNAATNDFDRLQFGGTTSSYPALKRSSAALSCRLADDSANAAFNCGNIVSSGSIVLNAVQIVQWNGRAAMYSPADGVIRLANNSNNGFTRLQFGGTTSSWPALGRSLTFVEVLLADGTAGGGILMSEGANFSLGGTTGTKLGVATTNKLGFWNATPVVQPTAIADASGGAIVDAEARTALNDLLAKLRTIGIIAT